MALSNLLSITVPSNNVEYTTFLDIAKMPHYEDVITRMYAWYFNENNNHGTGTWLKKTFLNIVKEKTGVEFILEKYELNTQVVIDTNERVDLLIEGESVNGKETVIIENKIYHSIQNDLISYWNNCGEHTGNKIGILLTLKPHEIPSTVTGKFINVTHKNVVHRLEKSIDLTTLNARQRVYAEDFIVTLKKLTKTFLMNEVVSFYFENAELVLEAVKSKKEAENFITSEFQIAGEKLGLYFSHYKTDYEFRYLSRNSKSNIYYTIFYDNLLNGKSTIKIVIEVNANGIKFIKLLEDEINAFSVTHLNFKTEVRKEYIHLLAQEYEINKLQLEALNETLVAFIETHFAPIMNKLELIVVE